jgi:hypothetical protein
MVIFVIVGYFTLSYFRLFQTILNYFKLFLAIISYFILGFFLEFKKI